MTHNTLSEKDENYSCLKTYSDLQFAVPECHQLQKMSFTDVTLYIKKIKHVLCIQS